MEAVRALGRPRDTLHAGRAYLAGVGTSGSLLAVAALVFIVASALVAFHGWPQVGAQPAPGEVVMSPSSASAATPVARRLAVAAAARPAGAAGTGVTAAPGHAPAGGGHGRGGGGSRTAAPLRQTIGAPPSTSTPVSAPVAGGPTSCGCATTPAPSSSSSPAQKVQQTVGAGDQHARERRLGHR